MESEQSESKKETWEAPEIGAIDVGETHRFNRTGADAGPYSTASRS